MNALRSIPNYENTRDKANSVPILMIDDDEFNIRLVIRAINAQRSSNPVVFAREGQRALEILRDWLGKAPVLPPLLILLDLNMPRMNGLEFLDELRSDPALRQACVFIYSTSTNQSNIEAAYDRSVTGYIEKRGTLDDAKMTLQMLDFYSKTVIFPTQSTIVV